MCALYPLFPSNFQWPEMEGQSYMNRLEDFSFESLQAAQPQPEPDRSGSFDNGDQSTTVKKLNHNASERDRRKKLNTLYASLRSLLPATDQKKRLSIPGTVSKVLKYVPELQQDIKRLIKKKEDLLQGISKKSSGGEKSSFARLNCLPTISASQLTDTEIAIQISTSNTLFLSTILLHLEQNGFMLKNASSFQSSCGWVFHNLHLEMDRFCKMECHVLSEKLLSLCEKSF